MSASAIGIKIIASWLILVAFHSPGSAQFLDSECGLRSPPVPYAKRIVKGANAGMTSSPWMVFIITKDDYFICGGTLITNRLVLTAAHCYHKHRHLNALLGEYDRDSKEICYYNVDGDLYCNKRVEISVDKGIMHPNFDPHTTSNDIAILRLARQVEYRENIKPICILLDKSWKNYIDDIDTLTATGWGFTRPNGTASIVLKTLQIRRQFPEICTEHVRRAPLPNEFCVGNLESGVCNGDSGGPIGKLILYRNRPRFIQIGVASQATHECVYASIFTDVMSHVDWIVSVKQRYGHGYTQPTRVRSPTRRYPNRYVPMYNIQWPRFTWSSLL